MEDKCPFCGAESSEVSINLGAIKAWACGTNYAQRRHYQQSKGKTISAACSALFRSDECYERQIANLTASRDRWKELAEAEMEDIGGEASHVRRERAIAALKEAGEWED